MEEINSLILYGCKLVRDLELNLQNFSNQPNKVFHSCAEIAGVFTAVRDRLNPSAYEPPVVAETGGGGVSEWFRYGVTQAAGTLLQVSGELSGGGGGGMEGAVQYGGAGGEVAIDVADSSRGGSMQRRRRRKDEEERRRIRVPAPRMGNTEIPPEDGHTWRKYGQKEILGTRFPRSYYRCTHQRLYNCPAKKQVQRLDNDPFTFEVTYRGDHTCHMSSTAPSVPTIPNEILPSQQPTPQTFTRWLSINPSGEGTSSTVYERFGSISTGAGTSSGGAGPSTVRFGTEGDYPLHVADLADAMFNTGSGGNNSMDLIFSSNVGEKWEPHDETK